MTVNGQQMRTPKRQSSNQPMLGLYCCIDMCIYMLGLYCCIDMCIYTYTCIERDREREMHCCFHTAEQRHNPLRYIELIHTGHGRSVSLDVDACHQPERPPAWHQPQKKV